MVIVGGGPSHADCELDLLRGRRLIAINSSCRRMRGIATADDILYFTDNSWAENRPELIAGWPGPVICANRNAKMRLGDAVRYIDVMALTARIGAAPDYVQASSGHIAACLAAVMGAFRLFLLGFEARAIQGRTHGHNDYQQHDLAAFDERFLPGWRGLSTAFKRMGVDVVNVTPQSMIDCFPFGHIEEYPL